MVRFKSTKFNWVFFVFVVVLFIVFVLSAPPVIVGSDVNYTFSEEQTYLHNLSLNVTGFAYDSNFSYETDTAQIYWTNSGGRNAVTEGQISAWISLTDKNTWGNLSFRPRYDNQTGYFEIPIQVTNTSNDEGAFTYFEFMINATNDVPNFTEITDNYVFPSDGSNPGYNITVLDEENHHPFNFTINFTNCSHAAWLGIPDGEECTLFNLTNFSSTRAQLNYSGQPGDVGVYNATITVYEKPHFCPHAYCVNATYSVIQSIQYNLSVQVLSNMFLNVSNCTGMNFTEGESKNCTVVIRTRNATDSFNLTSNASFLTYAGVPSNRNWFYSKTEHQASAYQKEINITVNAPHSLVGNWNINLTSLIDNASSLDYDEGVFPIFVNWTGNLNPTLSSLNNCNTSINLDYFVNFTVTDGDYAIEDKDFYDESITINYEVINLSSGGAANGFFYLVTGSLSGNVQNFALVFNATEEHTGNYTVNVNATDNSGVLRTDTFNISIIQNDFPYWNATQYVYNLTVNSTLASTVDNISNLNLSRSYANDSDVDDVLTFSVSGEFPPHFNLTSDGLLNFYPWKADVGFWVFNVTVTDTLGLSNDSLWVLNVSNINTNVTIADNSFVVNGTSYPGSLGRTINESDLTQISFSAYDDDLNISSDQVDSGYAYNESLTVTLNITNLTIVYTPLSFNFTLDTFTRPNQSYYLASFTPTSDNVGNYTIVMNVSDASGAYDILEFNLTVTGSDTPPNLNSFSNQETDYTDSNFNLTINATDYEDVLFGRKLNYTLSPLNGGPLLDMDLTTGYISYDFDSNLSTVGNWFYLVTVNDSASQTDTAVLNVIVNGPIEIDAPLENSVYTSVEHDNLALNLDVNYSATNINLTYYIYMDNISYWNSSGDSGFNYSGFGLVKTGEFNNTGTANLTTNVTLHGLDETYGLLKNISVVVLRSGFASYNKTIGYKLNCTHDDEPLQVIRNFSDASTLYGVPIEFDLTDYYLDSDSIDPYYDQVVNFTINDSSGLIVDEDGDPWVLSVSTGTWTSTAVSTFNISINSAEQNTTNFGGDNSSIRTFTSNWFTVTFNPIPPSSGGDDGADTRTIVKTKPVLQHFSLKIITPGDISISPDNYVELNFSVINNGNVDLYGIDLSSYVELDGLVNRDLGINLSDSYIQSLAVGERRDYTMKVAVNTEAVGEYRVVIDANVTSPKFSDWAEFFIKVRSLDESQLSQLLIFTEKLVSENPECIELRELYLEAVDKYNEGDFAETERIANMAINACEEAITANEQIKFFDDRVRWSLFYSIIATIALFLGGFIYYFYRRIKFKKLVDKDYV